MISLKSLTESNAEFEARINIEEADALTVSCPLVDSCGAEIGERCCTQAGQPRIRHLKRLMIARKGMNVVT